MNQFWFQMLGQGGPKIAMVGLIDGFGLDTMATNPIHCF
jgi:hypothetical protein